MFFENRLSSDSIRGAFIGGRAFPVAKDADYEIGGKALYDPSEGLNYQVWRCRLINDGVVLYDEKNNATTIYTGADISEISFSFDRNMNIALAFVQGGESKFYWYDSSLGAMTVTNFGSSVITPRVSHDDKRDTQSASSDVILAYVKNSSLYFRAQRDRYQTEYLLKSGDCKGLIKIGMNSKLRLQFLLEW